MQECPLCTEYDSWREHNLILVEDEICATAILSIVPEVPGQILLFPKQHITDSRGQTNWHAYEVRAFNTLLEKLCTRDYLVTIYRNLVNNPVSEKSRIACTNILTSRFSCSEFPTGYRTRQNAGDSAGQTLAHLHKHIIPTFGYAPSLEVLNKTGVYE